MMKEIIDGQKAARIKELIDRSRYIVIVTHVNPDGDAIGSSLGFQHYLQALGKKVVVIVPNQFPRFLHWMPGAKNVLVYGYKKNSAERFISTADLVFMLDMNQLSRAAEVAPALEATKARKVLIDHHLGPDIATDVTLSYPQLSSTCELVCRLLMYWDTLDRLSDDGATCLYTGMMTDTGSFSYNSNDPDIYYILYRLLNEKHVDKDAIYQRVNYNYSENRLRMEGHVLTTMEVFPDCHAALLMLTKEEEQQYGSQKGDTEGFVNLPLQIKDVIFTCFLREDTEYNQVKMSFRSVGDFPSNEVAQCFGGGGHKNASGAEFAGTMAEAREKFLEAMRAFQPRLEECFLQNSK